MNDKPIRVLFLNDHLGYAGGVIHGAGTYFVNLLPRIDPADVELTVCFFRERHPVAETLEAQGIYPTFFDRSKWDPRALIDLVRIILRRKVQILHVQGVKGILVGCLAAAFTGRRAIVHLHDSTPLQPGVRFLQRCLAPWISAVLTVSKAINEFAAREYRVPTERIKVLYNAMDLKPFTESLNGADRNLRQELGFKNQTPVVTVAGRIESYKGQAELIQAMPRLLRQCPDAKLLVVGDGAYRQRCEELVAKLGINEVVQFMGYRRDIPAIMAISDIVVMPSMCEEAFGFVALEAMASGKPVVAFDVGGVPELVLDGQTGLLVPRGDIEGLANAIIRILADNKLMTELGQNGRQRSQEFSIDKHIEQLVDIYRSVA